MRYGVPVAALAVVLFGWMVFDPLLSCLAYAPAGNACPFGRSLSAETEYSATARLTEAVALAARAGLPGSEAIFPERETPLGPVTGDLLPERGGLCLVDATRLAEGSGPVVPGGPGDDEDACTGYGPLSLDAIAPPGAAAEDASSQPILCRTVRIYAGPASMVDGLWRMTFEVATLEDGVTADVLTARYQALVDSADTAGVVMSVQPVARIDRRVSLTPGSTSDCGAWRIVRIAGAFDPHGAAY